MSKNDEFIASLFLVMTFVITSSPAHALRSQFVRLLFKRSKLQGIAATVLAGLLLANGCGGGGAAPIQVPPSLPDISGTYLFNFGTGPSGALAIASLTVTLNQTEWLNGINTLSISSGQLLSGCPGATNQTITIAAHLEWNGQQEKFVLSIDTSAGQNILTMTDDNFVAPYSGAWTPGSAFPPCNGQVAPLFSWTGVKR